MKGRHIVDANEFTKSKGNKMTTWIGTKLDWWPKDSSKGME
jgi:hypothetical protein